MSIRRLMLAGGLSAALIIPILGCGGGDDAATDEPVVDAPKGKKKAKKEKNRLVGRWRMKPPSEELRKFQIMDAAVLNKPKRLKKLGKLSASEQASYDAYKKASPKVKEILKNQLKLMKSNLFTFTDSQVTVQFGDSEVHGPVSYTVVKDNKSNTTIRFDPGLGNGTETHSIDWDNANKGTDHISAGSENFLPLDISRAKK